MASGTAGRANVGLYPASSHHYTTLCPKNIRLYFLINNSVKSQSVKNFVIHNSEEIRC